MPSLFFMLLILSSNMMSNIVSDLRILLSDFWLISPLVKLLINKSLTILDSIFSIKSALHLNWESESAIVKVQDGKTSRERSRGLEIVSEIDVWVSLLEVVDIFDLVVVIFYFFETEEV